MPIDQIVGTVEPIRSRCFDRRFRPTSEVPRTRFERIAADIRSGRGMDPVDLYRCGGRYYVLDGHHRIAVVRALGERWISANITDVRLNRHLDGSGGGGPSQGQPVEGVRADPFPGSGLVPGGPVPQGSGRRGGGDDESSSAGGGLRPCPFISWPIMPGCGFSAMARTSGPGAN